MVDEKDDGEELVLDKDVALGFCANLLINAEQEAALLHRPELLIQIAKGWLEIHDRFVHTTEEEPMPEDYKPIGFVGVGEKVGNESNV